MIRWLVGTWRRMYNGGQAILYRLNVSTDTEGPTIIFSLSGR